MLIIDQSSIWLTLLNAVVEDVPETIPDMSGENSLLMLIVGVVLTLILGGLGYLAAKFGWKTTPPAEPADLSKIDLTDREQRKEYLNNHVIPYMLESATGWMTSTLPIIAVDIADGGEFGWGQYWGSLRSHVRANTLRKFQGEGVALLEYMGSDAFDEMLDRNLIQYVGEFRTKLPAWLQVTLGDAFLDRMTDAIRLFLVERGREFINDAESQP